MNNRTLLATLCAGLLTGCAPNANVLTIDRFFEPVLGCFVLEDVNKAALQPGGTLDVSIFQPAYYVGVSVLAQGLAQAEVSTGATVLDTEDRDQPLLTGMTLSYRVLRKGKDVTPSQLKNKKFTSPLSIAALSKDFRAWWITNLIAYDAIEPLQGLEVVDTLAEGYDLRVAVEVTGKLSRSATPITTGPVEFAVLVIKTSPTTCNKPQRSTGPCSFTGQGSWNTLPTPRPAVTR
jgi:hypothetical protein